MERTTVLIFKRKYKGGNLMWDLILWPVKTWYTIVLVILIADKIVAVTPVPWDDLIVTSAKKVMEKIMSIIDNIIAAIIVKPVQAIFDKEKECCGNINCCK